MKRFGHVVLLGRPNAGKSTLLNELVGERLAMVSRKPQSTWVPVLGVRSSDTVQMVFVDPPGVIDPTQPMHDALVDSVRRSVRMAQCILHLVPVDETPEALQALVPEDLTSGLPVRLVRSKSDRGNPEGPGVPVSARTGEGLQDLVQWCEAQMPEGAFRHDPEFLGTQPLRFFATEYLREALFEHLGEELPYSIAVDVEEFREATDPVYIRLTAYVERDSQKGMLIGRGGRKLKEIGSHARARLEELIGGRVYLDVWVKVKHKWRRDEKALRDFGYLTDGG